MHTRHRAIGLTVRVRPVAGAGERPHLAVQSRESPL